MSIKLMSAIFETEFRDLQDDEGNTTKASTAKLVLLALADHANDEGEGAYPGLTKMQLKTSLSRQTILNTYRALKYNGIIHLAGVSKRNTNNYTINTKSFPKAGEDSQPTLLVNPLDQSTHLTSTGQPTLPVLVNPLDSNHPLTIQEPPIETLKTDESKGTYSTAYLRGEQEQPDKVSEWLKMAQFPGAKKQARIDAILSYLGESFRVQTERKDWKELAEYILVMQDKNGWSVEQFVRWLKSKPDFNIDYWTAARMKERYQQAFVAQTEQPSGKGFFA